MEAVKRFIAEFCKDLPFPLDNIIVRGREIYSQSPQLKACIEDIDEISLGAGLYLGERQGANIKASINLLKLIAPHTDKKITLDENTAWLFICGRDVFPENVKEQEKTKNLVIVENEKGEVLGLAKKTKMGSKELYKNLYDIGEFLRREQ